MMKKQRRQNEEPILHEAALDGEAKQLYLDHTEDTNVCKI